MGQPAERLAMPGDQEIERGLVDRRLGRARLRHQEALGALPFAIPFILARQRPDGVGGGLGRAMLLDEARSHLDAHVGTDRAGVFAAQPEGFQKALAGRGHVDPQLAKIVADHRGCDRRMGWGFVLNDLQRSQPRALIAAPAEEQPPVRRGRKQDGAGGRQIGVGIEIVRDPDRVAQDRRLCVRLLIDIDATHELDQLTGLGALMGAFGVDCL
ncbi:MAG: hypothetical protein U1A07_19345, partial [Phenylobacterium sp.]|nr:hypothetical protein [Phenylobacterium sp.]